MKYGKLDDISGVDFNLNADHPCNSKVLNGSAGSPDVRVAGTMWNIPEWVGTWYPTGSKPRDFLSSYSRIFNAIELNATHYRTPAPEVVRRWVSEVPDDFLFCPKFPQSVSHFRRFRNANDVTSLFLSSIIHFEHKLGPCFIQLPERYGPDYANELGDYLLALPRDLRVAVEFRHREWFNPDNLQAEEIWKLLTELGVTAVISDTAGRRDAVHMRLTSLHAIVRFGGNGMDSTDASRLSVWAQTAYEWGSRGLQSFHLWMHQPGSVVSPESCAFFSERVNRLTGRSVFIPRKPDQQ